MTTDATPPAATPAAATHTEASADSPPASAAQSEDTMLAAASSVAVERNYQKAYLLLQMQEARGGQLSKGKANRFPRPSSAD